MDRKYFPFLSCSFFRKMCQLLHGKYHYNDVVVILIVKLATLNVIIKKNELLEDA
jgi:hypothetical protein